jgi:outer membrane protein assembly factor BamE (lipoprotein component of BamABCDE complex)
MKNLIYIFAAVILLAGCVSYGRKIDEAKVEEIKTGQTTRAQVIQLIGSPDQITSTGNSFVTFNYMFIHASPTAATYIPIVGAFAGGANTQNQVVMVSFTNGVVSSFTSSYGGNEMGTGATAASTTSMPAVTEDKRPK